MPHAPSRLLSLSLRGTAAGAIAGALVLAFRAVVEGGQGAFLPGGVIGNYEALAPPLRLGLPVVTGVVLGLLFRLLPPHLRGVGIVHVLDRLRFSRERDLPASNAVIQFVGAAVALLGGHSVDREGPGVHVGAAGGNLLARHTGDAAEEEVLTLTACGAAAAVAAAFNTPLAGTLFAVEVLLVRYSVPRFIPVAVAAVVASLMSRLVYGHQPAFAVPPVALGSVWETPWLVLLGVAAGALAGLFSIATRSLRERTFQWSPLYAFPLAGAATGLIALAVPQVMGISYDTLQAMLAARLAPLALVAILVGKLVATSVAIGLRVPGGLIGPTLVMGGALGTLVGVSADGVMASATGGPGLYAMVGMVATMGAALRAPLSALLALLELTGNPNILLPGLLAVATAELAVAPVLGRASIFEQLLTVQRKGVGAAG